ncbi:MAG: EAL domain-containing protein [Candidatus Nitricoxidivorans perseverans]|uniref:EAL domain-containing protein n=1 Tax=Candidatus Nitricoxidivorans perseverans TaxID=2975601 RepID=A0AA49IY19_9PROT|nr:MAG: EAL domain-containing protein [Candidatus Nitricoxidivorans perseverans]
MRIRTFILSASAVVAIGFFSISYFAIGRIVDHTVRENARASSAALADVTFTGMYQVMSAGWKRKQAENYIAAVRDAARDLAVMVQIYRGPVVEADYGRIEQPPMDESLLRALVDGRPVTESPEGGVRYLRPLVANERCLRCHEVAKEGDVMGVIEVRQEFAPLLARAHNEFMLWLLALAPLAMAVAALVVWRVNRRLEQSIGMVDSAVTKVNAVADLRHIAFSGLDLGFEELNRLFVHLGDLVEKLRAVAVDKGVLKFEIGLLEKFVITSDVVRDWGEYIARMLAEINTVMTTHVLFSVFQVDDEVFDLDIFWAEPPSATTRAMMENHVRSVVAADHRLSGLAHVTLYHHVPPGGGEELEIDSRAVVLQTKALILEQPKIGGIVGIGVNTSVMEDPTLRLVMDSILSTMLNVVGSVKAIHKYTRDMEYYATRDPLTDLYNRRVFWELFEYEVARAGRQGYSFALLVIDLDNFKLVNDGHGHTVGDRYLQALAHVVKQVLRPGDILARYGGDEFVILLPDVMQDMAVMVARRVMESVAALSLPISGGEHVSGSVSMGMAIFPLHAGNAKDLFLFADNMMYRAKSAGKNQIGIPGEEDVAAVFRDMTETTVMVVNAVNEGRIDPFFQPIMDLHSGRVVGFEVLSRLSLEGKHMEASRFIEYAEKAGIIHRLDTLVMEKALRAVADHRYAGRIFLNLSPRALSLSNFLSTLKRVVADCGIAPEQIVFEITERDTVRNIMVLEKLVSDLKMAGFKLAIDDFGSGFSSFQYLRRLPVDFLKIEGEFIVNMLENEKDRAFVETIRRLASSLDIHVIAEHVESEEVLDALREMGVELAQGYFIGRPEKELGGNLRWPMA